MNKQIKTDSHHILAIAKDICKLLLVEHMVRRVFRYSDKKGIIFPSSPVSRAAVGVGRLQSLAYSRKLFNVNVYRDRLKSWYVVW